MYRFSVKETIVVNSTRWASRASDQGHWCTIFGAPWRRLMKISSTRHRNGRGWSVLGKFCIITKLMSTYFVSFVMILQILSLKAYHGTKLVVEDKLRLFHVIGTMRSSRSEISSWATMWSNIALFCSVLSILSWYNDVSRMVLPIGLVAAVEQ